MLRVEKLNHYNKQLSNLVFVGGKPSTQKTK